jgi:uncharacterized protein (DUF697 family)
MGANKTIFFAVDCEYAKPKINYVSDKNYITYDVIDTGCFTIVDGKEFYHLFRNTNFIFAIDKIINNFPDYREYVIYTFFSTAELSTTSLDDIYRAGFKITRLYRSMRGYNLQLTYKVNGSNKIIKIIDARILTSVENLESLIKLFAPDVENPKEYRKKVLGSDEVDDDFYVKMTQEEQFYYNYLDCRGLYIAIQNFKAKMVQLIEDIFGLDISQHVNKIETLGGFAKLVIKSLDKHGLLKSYSDNLKEKQNVDANVKEIFKIGWKLYRGGGLIINYAPLLQKSKLFKNVNLYDVKSLYPLSGYLASYFLAGFEHCKFIHKFGKDAVKFILNFDVKKYGGYIYIGLKFDGGINGKPYVGYRKVAKEIDDTDDIENYRICYTKQIPPQWYTIQEAKFILEHGYKLDDSIDVNHVKLFAWEVDEKLIYENPLYIYFGKLLEYRLKQKDEIFNKLVKMLLNIAYGKIAQHKQQSKNNVIVNPIVAGYLTSISRVIMFHFVDIAIHMATDSVFTHVNVDEKEYRRKIENTLQVRFPEFYTSFLSNEGNGDVFIYKCKSYLFVKSDGFKVAHHGLRLRGKNNAVKFFQMIQSLKSNEPVIFVIKRHDWYSFDIIKHWIELKTEKIVTDPNVVQQIQQLQKLIFKPMLLTQIHIMSADHTFKLDGFDWKNQIVSKDGIFDTIIDYENNLLDIERQKIRIRNQLKTGSQQIKSTTRLNQSLSVYKNKIKVIEIDCR